MSYYYHFSDFKAGKDVRVSSYLKAERLFANVAQIKAGKPIATRVRIYSGDGTKTPAFYRATVAGCEMLYLHSDGTLELASGPEDWRRAGIQSVVISGSRYLPIELVRTDIRQYGVITDKLCTTLEAYFREVAQGRSPDAPPFIGERGDQMRQTLDKMTGVIRAVQNGTFRGKQKPRYVSNILSSTNSMPRGIKLWATTLAPFVSQVRRGLRFNTDGIAVNDTVRVSKSDQRMLGLSIDMQAKKSWDDAFRAYRRQIRTMAAIGALDYLTQDILAMQASPRVVSYSVVPAGLCDVRSDAGIMWRRIAQNLDVPDPIDMLLQSIRSGCVEQDVLHWLVWHSNATHWLRAGSWTSARYAPTSVQMGTKILAFLTNRSFDIRTRAGVIIPGKTAVDSSQPSV